MGRTICCSIRCIDPDVVEASRRRLAELPAVLVPYVCKISGNEEKILLVADGLADELVSRHSVLATRADAVICMAVSGSELCECDVAAIAQIGDEEAASRLDELEQLDVVRFRVIDGMRYYRLVEDRLLAEAERLEPASHVEVDRSCCGSASDDECGD